jgi:hypothetical protein
MGPARFHCATLLVVLAGGKLRLYQLRIVWLPPKTDGGKKSLLSEVGFEPTPTEVDCDLNAAP